jgi:hypothetical protein
MGWNDAPTRYSAASFPLQRKGKRQYRDDQNQPAVLSPGMVSSFIHSSIERLC